MKTRTRTVVKCEAVNPQEPCVLTAIEHRGKRMYLGSIEIVHYQGVNQGRLVMQFREEHELLLGSGRYRYYSFVHEAEDAVTTKLILSAQELGLTLEERSGYISFLFKLGRKQFCQQAIELMLKLNAVLGIGEKKWMQHTKIFQETQVHYKGNWRTYAGHLLNVNGII